MYKTRRVLSSMLRRIFIVFVAYFFPLLVLIFPFYNCRDYFLLPYVRTHNAFRVENIFCQLLRTDNTLRDVKIKFFLCDRYSSFSTYVHSNVLRTLTSFVYICWLAIYRFFVPQTCIHILPSQKHSPEKHVTLVSLHTYIIMYYER